MLFVVQYSAGNNPLKHYKCILSYVKKENSLICDTQCTEGYYDVIFIKN